MRGSLQKAQGSRTLWEIHHQNVFVKMVHLSRNNVDIFSLPPQKKTKKKNITRVKWRCVVALFFWSVEPSPNSWRVLILVESLRCPTSVVQYSIPQTSPVKLLQVWVILDLWSSNKFEWPKKKKDLRNQVSILANKRELIPNTTICLLNVWKTRS